MKKVIIKRNTNGDSRVATHIPNFNEFVDSNESHINDVYSMMSEFADILKSIGNAHDWSKVKEPYRSMFYRDMCNTIDGKMKFESGEWVNFHYSRERHHLLRNIPEDVNLFDVLEMIADCVCAGMARSGGVRPLEIADAGAILVEAMKNTVELAMSLVEIEEE